MEDKSFAELDELFIKRNFFVLQDALAFRKEKSPELVFYRGVTANKFNRMQESIGLLEEYLKTGNPTGNKLLYCYELLGDNYAKSYQYHRAAEYFKIIIEQFGDEFGEDKKQD